MDSPYRGQVWSVNLNPTRGHEQAGIRPCLIVSDDRLNQGAAGLAIIIPLTSRRKGIPFHVEVAPPEGGIDAVSFIKCEDVRSVSIERFVDLWGTVNPHTMRQVEDRLRVLLHL